MLHCRAASYTPNCGVHPTNAAEIQAAQLQQYVNSLGPLKYWDRRTFASGINSNNAINKRNQLFYVDDSKAVPGCRGVFTRQTVNRNTGLHYEYKKLLLDGMGWLMTYKEFQRMPTACYTAIELDEDVMRQWCPEEKSKLVLVCDPTTLAATVVSSRGPNDTKAGICTPLHLSYSVS